MLPQWIMNGTVVHITIAVKALTYFYATDHMIYNHECYILQNNEYDMHTIELKESLHYTPVETLADHIAPQAMSTEGSASLKTQCSN